MWDQKRDHLVYNGEIFCLLEDYYNQWVIEYNLPIYYDTAQDTVGEGYRVTMPSGGSTINEYKAAIACNGT